MSDLIPVEQSTPVLRHGSDTALRMLRVAASWARGLDPEDWCETTEGPASITIHGDTEADR